MVLKPRHRRWATPRPIPDLRHRRRIDAAHKLAILTTLAFGTEIDLGRRLRRGHPRRHQRRYRLRPSELGYRIKLLGVARRRRRHRAARASLHGARRRRAIAHDRRRYFNAVVDPDGDFVGEIVAEGPGAGGDATASAVVADIVDIARGARAAGLRRDPGGAALTPYTRARCAARGRYYIRLEVYDRPGRDSPTSRRGCATRTSRWNRSMQRGRDHARRVPADVLIGMNAQRGRSC